MKTYLFLCLLHPENEYHQCTKANNEQKCYDDPWDIKLWVKGTQPFSGFSLRCWGQFSIACDPNIAQWWHLWPRIPINVSINIQFRDPKTFLSAPEYLVKKTYIYHDKKILITFSLSNTLLWPLKKKWLGEKRAKGRGKGPQESPAPV